MNTTQTVLPCTAPSNEKLLAKTFPQLDADLFGNTPPRNPRTYADIKELAKATGRNIPDLLAMACQNDPFYIMPAQEKQAEWFADLWKRFDLPAGVHLRRIHYKLVSQPKDKPVLMLDGRKYENTERCWGYLGNASKAARYLAMVDAGDFEDQRNPDPVLHREYPDPRAPWLSFDATDWDLPRIDARLTDDFYWRLPTFEAFGYSPNAHNDPFHLELISEKSTMDDIIVPLCRELAINYAPATGFQSITGVIDLLKRLRQANKPGVVFYISDFDPAGAKMAPAVARQIEYWLPQFAPGLDIVLLPIVLTKEQVLEYDLPPMPIKDTDKRQDNFLEKYDVKGATELDALEALKPGELGKIIRQAVKPYRDGMAQQEQRRQGWNVDREISRQWGAICRPYQWRLERLQEQASDIVESYQDALARLRDDMDEELASVERELNSLRQAVKADAVEFDPELPDRYESPLTLPDQFPGLFDSRRGYLEQLAFYKKTNNGTEASQ